MRRYLLLLLLILPLMARGQTQGQSVVYWYDQDVDARCSVDLPSFGAFHVDADVGSLPSGLHSLYLAVVDSDGSFGAPVSRYFLKTIGGGGTGRYWFDNDYQNAKSCPNDGTFLVDVSNLSAGIHVVNMTVGDSNGSFSVPVSRFFIKTIGGGGTGRYWFDENHQDIKKTLMEGAFQVDVSMLTEGIHTFHFVGVSPNGSTTQMESRTFIKMAPLKNVDSLFCQSYIDETPWQEERVAVNDGLLSWQLDVKALPQGFHRLQVQLFLPNGQSAGNYNVWFVREPTTYERSNFQCLYSIDGEAEQRQAGQLADGTYHFDLDVATLSDGLHRISYYLGDLKGIQTEILSAFFVKVPLGGEGLTSWQWWLNSQPDTIYTTTLPQPIDTLRIKQMLPVGHQPLRTQSFHFEAMPTPTIYAKNQLHLRFNSLSRRSTEQVCDYVDYEVSQPVEEIGELLSLDSHTFAKPAAGEIRWYKLQMNPGDSLLLWADSPCMIEAFSHKGDVLYKANETQSRTANGFEAPDTMTCYVALHDTQGNGNITLNYKYSKWETPDLAISVSESQLQEGQSVVVTVSRNRMQQITVNLTFESSQPDRFVLPVDAVIPAGMESTEVTLQTIDDERYNAPCDITITASALRHNSALLTLHLTDNEHAMDMAEWQLLKQWYEAQQDQNWKHPWTFGATPETTDSLDGVYFRNGHVLQVCLSDNGISGVLQPQVFRLPYIEIIDLSRNQLSGTIDDDFANQMPKDAPLCSLNISHNQIGGNIGLLCRDYPSLRWLDASYNCFSDVIPALPTSIEEGYFNLEHQQPDRSIYLSEISACPELSAVVPTILLYRYGKPLSEELSLQLTDETGWNALMELSKETLTISSNRRAVFTQPSGSIVTGLADNSHLVELIMDYEPGDANLDGQTDVVDLQHTVNFAMTDNFSGVFCLPAADLQPSEVIDVLDVIRLVKLLLKTDVPATMRSLQALPSERRRSQAVAEAKLFVRDDQLVLLSPYDVAAIDVVLSKSSNNQAKWILRDNGYQLSSHDDGGQTHFIHYSLTGKTIPAGETILATGISGVVSATMADNDANRIAVLYEGSAVTDIVEVNSDNMMKDNIYDLQGRRIAEGMSGNLRKGIYLKGSKKYLKK